MSNSAKKPLSKLQDLADHVLDSIAEDPKMEPDEADTTPASRAKRGADEKTPQPKNNVEKPN